MNTWREDAIYRPQKKPTLLTPQSQTSNCWNWEKLYLLFETPNPWYFIMAALGVYVLSHFSGAQLCVTLWTAACQAPLWRRDVHGMLQARTLEWAAMPSSRGSSPPQGWNLSLLMAPSLAGGFFAPSTTWAAPWQPLAD